MGKPKQRPLVVKQPDDLDLHGEDSWVIVKKQRVTILVPPLPYTKKSALPKTGPSKQEAVPMKTVNNKSRGLIQTCIRMPVVHQQERVTSLASSRDIQMASKNPPVQSFLALQNFPKLNVTMESKRQDPANTFNSHSMLGVSNVSKAIKRSRFLHGTGSFLDGRMFLNQRLRASLLEKKIQKAGGLSKWLASLGLGHFVKIFQGKGINKFQLVNLTMKKLKDMGADAVGPRRKLMHAIDCICQPYCFEVC